MVAIRLDLLNDLLDNAKIGKLTRRAAIKGGAALGVSGSLMNVLLSPSVSHAQLGEGGELVVGVAREPACWNPIEGPCGSDVRFHDLVMERLLVWDENDQLAPGLATEWSAVDDLTWEVKLREGITFTNGEVFNADTVVHTFGAIMEPEGRNPPPTAVGSYRSLAEIEVVDEYNLIFHTSEPFPLLTRYFAFEPRAVPPTYYDEIGWERFGQEPIGTGPYTLIEWVRSDHFTLEANEDYWNGPPDIKRIMFRPIPEASTRVAELMTNGIHISDEIPGELISSLENTPEISAKVLESRRVVYINLRSEEYTQEADESVTRQGLSLEMREAFQYATNMQPILDTVLGGLGELVPAGNPVTSAEFGFDETIPDWPYDPDMAREKLEEAGYDGAELELYYATDSIAQIDATVQALQAQWAEVGLNVSIHSMEAGVFNERHRARTHPGDIHLSSTGGKTNDSDDRLVPLVHSYDPSRGLGRISFFSDPEIDDLIERSQLVVDEEEREALLKEAWRLHRDSAHMITLYSPAQIYGVNEALEWEPSVDGLYSTLADASTN